MDTFIKDLGKVMLDTSKMYTNPQLLQAIWLNKPLKTANETTVRIEAGQLVKVCNGELIDCIKKEDATHKILECWGTLVNQFEVVLEPLEGGETLTIQL